MRDGLVGLSVAVEAVNVLSKRCCAEVELFGMVEDVEEISVPREDVECVTDSIEVVVCEV